MTLKAMFKLMDGYTTTIDKISKKTDEATDKILKASTGTDKFNKKLDETEKSATKASGGLGKLISVAAMVASAMKGMEISDSFMNTSARLNLINDGLQTQAELQDKIFASAERSRGKYGEMANAISKMGLLAKDSFTSNDELVGFTELVQKSFKISGADTSEQQGAMRQLTQAMASGRLQGDELVSIQENAPMIYNAIAKYMNLSKGELKKLSSEGAITSDIIKNAIFMAGDDINAKFGTMPRTFADVWTRISNGGIKAFDKVIKKINKVINTKGFDRLIDGVIIGFNGLANTISFIIDVFVEGWDIIEPILIAITGIYLKTMAVKLWALVAPVAAQAAAWLGIYWPILAVAAAIGVVIWAMKEMGVTTEDTFNVMGGALGGFIANVNNAVAYLWNPLASLINFFANAFTNLGASIEIFIWDIVHTIISGVNSMIGSVASALNVLPGVNIDATSNYDKVLADIEGRRSKLKADSGWTEVVKSMTFMDNESAMQGGGKALNNIASMLEGKLNETLDALGGYDPNDFLGSPLTVQGKNGAVEVEMSDEDLRYLRDIAEREYINKFSTATLAPNVVFNISDIKETADINEIKGRLEEIMREEIATVGEGVYDV